MLDVSQMHDTFGFAPFIVPLIMAGAQVYQGIHQASVARKKEKEAEALQNAIPAEDPGVRSMADEIRQRRINAELGQTSMLGYKRRMAEEAGRNMGDNLVRAAGSSPGATQQALLRGQNVTQDNLMRAGAETESMVPRYMAMETPLIQDIADRKLSTQQNLSDRQFFQSAQARQNSNNAIMGALGQLSGISFSGGGGVNGTEGNGAPGDISGLGDPGTTSAHNNLSWLNGNAPTSPTPVHNYKMLPGSVPDREGPNDPIIPYFDY